VPGKSCSLEGFHLLGISTAKPSPAYGTKPAAAKHSVQRQEEAECTSQSRLLPKGRCEALGRRRTGLVGDVARKHASSISVCGLGWRCGGDGSGSGQASQHSAAVDLQWYSGGGGGR
jgi:hypothetical protein